MSDNESGKRDAHESEPIRIGVFLDVFWQVATRHPFRDELVVVDGNAQQGQDIRVCQMFPCYSLLAEVLSLVNICGQGEQER